MTARHSLGPWTLKQDQKWPFRLRTFDANGDEVAVAELAAHSTSDKTAEAANAREGNAEVIANETLRAAAPELLASLQDAIRPFAGDTSPPRWVAVARAVIAKATAA